MLDWEENLFVGLKAIYQRLVVRPRQRARDQVAARLADRRQSLLVLAQMIAGRPLSIFASADPVLHRGERIFFPETFDVARSAAGNAALFDMKAVLAGLSVRDAWYRNGVPLAGLAARYFEEFPNLRACLERTAGELPEGTEFWPLMGTDWGQGPAETDAILPMDAGAGPEPAINRVTTEIQGRGSAEVEVLPGQDGDGVGADLPMHTFEKVETVEEYAGQSRKTDSADELAEHAEGLSELAMTQVMRSRERPQSVYRSPLILDGLSLEVGDVAATEGVPYPEWNHRQGAYRENWCRVQEQPVAESHSGWVTAVRQRHDRLLRQLRRQFASLTSEWQRRRRQPSGDEFDLDAVVDAEVERRTGHSPRENFYLDRRREAHDVAALIVLDQSYSTDAWLENRRVLDVIRESVFCVGEVLEHEVSAFAVAAFSSNTRRSCRVDVVKSFRDPWRNTCGRLGVLEPCGYTRIGPALRHAQRALEAQPAARKMVILLTDGRPCDYDRYEGTYGIKDVRKAIEEGVRQGIHSHAFAIEKQAAEYFPQMFARRDFDILPHPDHLARTMCRLFVRLLAG